MHFLIDIESTCRDKNVILDSMIHEKKLKISCMMMWCIIPHHNINFGPHISMS
jgi:hypothetical protein